MPPKSITVSLVPRMAQYVNLVLIPIGHLTHPKPSVTVKLSPFKTKANNVSIAMAFKTVNNAQIHNSASNAIPLNIGFRNQKVENVFANKLINNGITFASSVKSKDVKSVMKRIIVLNVTRTRNLTLNLLKANVNVNQILIWIKINAISVPKK